MPIVLLHHIGDILPSSGPRGSTCTDYSPRKYQPHLHTNLLPVVDSTNMKSQVRLELRATRHHPCGTADAWYHQAAIDTDPGMLPVHQRSSAFYPQEHGGQAISRNVYRAPIGFDLGAAGR